MKLSMKEVGVVVLEEEDAAAALAAAVPAWSFMVLSVVCWSLLFGE